jgi:hypothetical protein
VKERSRTLRIVFHSLPDGFGKAPVAARQLPAQIQKLPIAFHSLLPRSFGVPITFPFLRMAIGSPKDRSCSPKVAFQTLPIALGLLPIRSFTLSIESRSLQDASRRPRNHRRALPSGPGAAHPSRRGPPLARGFAYLSTIDIPRGRFLPALAGICRDREMAL